MNSYRKKRSWATTPIFYEAPWPETCKFVPSPYQHAGVEFRIQAQHGMIADAPGLGKTCEGVLTSNAMEAKRTLVLCPASLRLNWQREIWLWSNIEDVSTYPILKSSDGVSLKHDYVIASFDGLRNDGVFEALLDGWWDHCIVDEAHYLKNPKGNIRTQRTLGHTTVDGDEYDGVFDRCGSITLLTGTPMPNQPIEIYNAARLIDWSSIDEMSLESFRDYYYSEGWGFKTGWHEVTLEDGSTVMRRGKHRAKVRNRPRRMPELQERLRGSFMCRRLKEQVLPQLPPKEWHLFPVVANRQIKRVTGGEAWKTAEKLYELNPEDFGEEIPISGEISTVRREIGEALAPMSVDYCEQLLSEGVEKLVVVAWHHSVLKFLRERLTKYGLVYMDGATSAHNKQNAVDKFQEHKGTRIILGQQQPLGLGWTLTAAQDVVFAEYDWVPGNNDQLLDRIHRLGQLGNRLLGHLLFVPDTLMEKMLNRITVKSRNIYDALDNDPQRGIT